MSAVERLDRSIAAVAVATPRRVVGLDLSLTLRTAQAALVRGPRCRPERTVRCPKGPDSLDVVGCGREFTDRPDDEGWFDCPHCGLGFNPDHPHSAPQPSGAP